jgi:hypothetical protein
MLATNCDAVCAHATGWARGGEIVRHTSARAEHRSLGQVYKGLDMRSAHAHLLITNDVYDAVVDHLLGTLVSLLPDTPPPVLEAVIALTVELRPLIQNAEKLPAVPHELSNRIAVECCRML